jgi:hypothetical protein
MGPSGRTNPGWKQPRVPPRRMSRGEVYKEDAELYSGVYIPPAEGGSIGAIPTEYNGRTYRSRIEARWALLFDLLKLQFMYEPQVVETPLGNYLPDFFLPTQSCWVEIKGPHPTWQERTKAQAVARKSGRLTYIFACGIPIISMDGAPRYKCDTPATGHGWRFDAEGTEVTGFMFGVKECCGRVGIVFNALTNLMACDCPVDKYNPGYLYSLQLAFQKARLRPW